MVQHHIVNTLGWSSLRPLQEEAIDPLLDGRDAVLLAPTAGGKTEAAIFPLLSRMEFGSWTGLSVIYVCPLKALLNNLQPRLDSYAGWLGRSASIRHGDTPSGVRKQQTTQPPSILLTTPESLEAMLVSTRLDAASFFADVRAVVIDEVHAFAGDDRGWHLLAVLERLSTVAGRRLQRVGLSATVGNAAELAQWIQGRPAGGRSGVVVAPSVESGQPPELTLDYVGNVANAATVLSKLYAGEKRLVFADSRRTVEDVASHLRTLGVETYVSHSSLSLEERRRSETAFAEARNCVIVSTSTLELGIDVGDLDRVIQLGAPTTVASMLQRLGRTGRRPGSTRNMTFLALDDSQFVRATALLLLLGEGFVEPVVAPPEPRHIAAQQFLGLALQAGQIDINKQGKWMAELGLASTADLQRISRWLIETGHLDTDSGLAFVGPTAERRYGARNFMELLAVFTAAPEVTVMHGRSVIGSIDPTVLTTKATGPRVISLAGRAWRVTQVDWRQRRCFVEPSEARGRSRWTGDSQAYSFELTDAIRRVLLGADPAGATLSSRAGQRLSILRETMANLVSDDGTIVAAEDSRARWWTFAGMRGNAILAAALEAVAPGLLEESSYSNLNITLHATATGPSVATAMREARRRFGMDLGGVVPPVNEQAVRKLKFSELLPPDLATRTLAIRGADYPAASWVAARPVVSAVARD